MNANIRVYYIKYCCILLEIRSNAKELKATVLIHTLYVHTYNNAFRKFVDILQSKTQND